MGLFSKSKKRRRKRTDEKIDGVEDPWLLGGEMKKITVIFQERRMRNHKMNVKTKSFTMEVPRNLPLEEFVYKVKYKLKKA